MCHLPCWLQDLNGRPSVAPIGEAEFPWGGVCHPALETVPSRRLSLLEGGEFRAESCSLRFLIYEKGGLCPASR